MSAKKKTVISPPPPDAAFAARQARFVALCEAERLSDRPAGGSGIGTYQEKRLHAVLKEFYCPPGGQAEVQLSEELLTGSHPDLTDAATRRARDRYVADLLDVTGTPPHIIEIQTGGFYPLVKKLHFYLCATEARVTLVHPIIAVKHTRWMDPDTGELTAPRRSPRRGKPTDIARELYWILPYLAEPRFSLCLPLLEAEETRLKDGWSRDRKRGSHRYDRFPLSLCDEVVLSAPEDYAALFLPLPEALPAPFTAAEYAKAIKLRGRAVYAMLRMLVELRFLIPGEPRGRAGTWQRL